MSADTQFVEDPRSSAYVGVVPAAGLGSRLPERKLSKEMLPVGGVGSSETPAIGYLLGRMRDAGIVDVSVVLRQGKWDIADYLAKEEWDQMRFGFSVTRGTSGVPETVALGLHNKENKNIAFGFPDILFEPIDAYTKMIDRLESCNAKVVLGLFPTADSAKMDMVEADADGTVVDIDIKPRTTDLSLAWILAVWKPVFSEYLCRFVAKTSNKPVRLPGASDSHLGHVFKQAISDGIVIDTLAFPNGRSLDIGTPEDLALAQHWPNQLA